MPREKKKKLKKRPDGRYACRYRNQWFYSYDHDDCLRQREAFKEAEKRGQTVYFVHEYAEKWAGNSFANVTPKTANGNRRHIQKMVNVIGDLPVSDVKPSDIKSVYAKEYRGMSQSYTLAGKQLICALFDSAVADGLILSNPARDRTSKPDRGKSGGHRSITPQERELILTRCTDHRMYPAAMVMLYAGLRPQEAKALDIDRDVDFDREIITVRETAHVDGQKYAFSAVGKTARANRTVPLLPPLKQALFGKHGLLMTKANGEPVTRTVAAFMWTSYKRQIEKELNGMTRNWYGRTREHKAILAAGGKLPPWVSFDVTPYDLRHSFATMCRSQVPPIEMHTVIKWMGHSDATMILQIYDSVPDERDNAEAKRLLENLTTELTTKPCL